MRIGDNIFLKVYGIHWEAYIDNGCNLYCHAKGMIGNEIIVDYIHTPRKFRRRGYGTKLIEAVKEHFNKDILPFAIENTECATGFWNTIEVKTSEFV